MEEINEENDWDNMTEGDTVEGRVEKVSHEEMVTAIKAVKPGKAAGPFQLCAEIIFASGEVKISVRMELCQRVLNGKEMPGEC